MSSDRTESHVLWALLGWCRFKQDTSCLAVFVLSGRAWPAMSSSSDATAARTCIVLLA